MAAVVTLLKDEAYTKLKNMISAKKLGFGTVYSLNSIASELGMSKTPVRDAVQRLNDERVVDLLPSRGFVLHKITEEELLELYHFSCAVEGYSIYCLAEAYKKGEKKEIVNRLSDNISRMRQLKNADSDFLEILKLDDEFHLTVVDSIDDLFLRSEAMNRRGFIGHPELHLTQEAESIQEMIDEHESMLQAIYDGSPAQVYEELLKHAEKIYRSYLKLFTME